MYDIMAIHNERMHRRTLLSILSDFGNNSNINESICIHHQGFPSSNAHMALCIYLIRESRDSLKWENTFERKIKNKMGRCATPYIEARNQQKSPPHYTKRTQQLPFKNITQKSTTKPNSFTVPNTARRIRCSAWNTPADIPSLVCESDIEVVHDRLYNLLFKTFLSTETSQGGE